MLLFRPTLRTLMLISKHSAHKKYYQRSSRTQILQSHSFLGANFSSPGSTPRKSKSLRVRIRIMDGKSTWSRIRNIAKKSRAGTLIRIQTGQTTFFQIISIEQRNRDVVPLVVYEFLITILCDFPQLLSYLIK